MCTCIHACTHTHTHTHTHKHTHTHIHTHTHYIYTHTHTHHSDVSLMVCAHYSFVLIIYYVDDIAHVHVLLHSIVTCT